MSLRLLVSVHQQSSHQSYIIYYPDQQMHDIYIYIYKVNQSHYRPEVLRWFQGVKVPRLRDNGPGWW